ncbi:hypothetical protein C8N32_101124 [Rhodovulum imhoffii]|uniref:Nickel/cobalt transporter regulator n=2 Tax=Rhodovulum imhoffii TaxID=365340 RepID=A0A2T5BWD8_9RHOB|nr:hypothetical protein C8N32_101124 [Rhodovulum imhoffii]
MILWASVALAASLLATPRAQADPLFGIGLTLSAGKIVDVDIKGLPDRSSTMPAPRPALRLSARKTAGDFGYDPATGQWVFREPGGRIAVLRAR